MDMPFFLTFLLLLAPLSATAEIYTWKDESGVTHFAQEKPADQQAESVEVEEQKPATPVEAIENISEPEADESEADETEMLDPETEKAEAEEAKAEAEEAKAKAEEAKAKAEEAKAKAEEAKAKAAEAKAAEITDVEIDAPEITDAEIAKLLEAE